MAARRPDPSQVMKSDILAPVLLLLAFTSPVVASQNPLPDCPQLQETGLQVPLLKLAAASIGDYRDGSDPDAAALSTQRATTARAVPPEAKPRSVLSRQSLFDTATSPRPETELGDAQGAATQLLDSADRFPSIQTRIPGVSSVELQRFKRQMFRRDI